MTFQSCQFPLKFLSIFLLKVVFLFVGALQCLEVLLQDANFLHVWLPFPNLQKPKA